VIFGMTDAQSCYVSDEISRAWPYHLCHASVCISSRKEKVS
jgi:hypothetical protein